MKEVCGTKFYGVKDENIFYYRCYCDIKLVLQIFFILRDVTLQLTCIPLESCMFVACCIQYLQKHTC